MATLSTPLFEPYIFCYSHGWQLVGAFLDRDPHDGPRRLLTEQLLPEDLVAPPDPPAPGPEDLGPGHLAPTDDPRGR